MPCQFFSFDVLSERIHYLKSIFFHKYAVHFTQRRELVIVHVTWPTDSWQGYTRITYGCVQYTYRVRTALQRWCTTTTNTTNKTWSTAIAAPPRHVVVRRAWIDMRNGRNGTRRLQERSASDFVRAYLSRPRVREGRLRHVSGKKHSPPFASHRLCAPFLDRRLSPQGASLSRFFTRAHAVRRGSATTPRRTTRSRVGAKYVRRAWSVPRHWRVVVARARAAVVPSTAAVAAASAAAAAEPKVYGANRLQPPYPH